MITKPNPKINFGISQILPGTFLARSNINNAFGITRKSGMNGVISARLKTRK